MKSADRNGHTVKTYDGQRKSAEFLYETRPGRAILRILIRPWVSETAGWFLNRRLSALLISGFIRKNHIRISDYLGAPYPSFNAFFSRDIRPEKRPVDMARNRMVSPCDGKLTICRIEEGNTFFIKGVSYTMESLLRDKALAAQYRGGYLFLFRLTVDDCHRYCYPADGTAGREKRIPGVFHTVQPEAAARRAIYRENTREYMILETETFGPVLMMEVGAMMVGRIVNPPMYGQVHKGEEKGYFEFGGSSIILCIPRGRLLPDEDLLRNTAAGRETVIKRGEGIGHAAERQ